MEPIDLDLVKIQDDIREHFGWSLEDDYNSALKLVKACENPEPNLSLKGKVTVVGAAAPENLVLSNPTVVADGAIGAIANYANVKLIVTDGDGTPYIEEALNKGIPICLHAHGDNKESWNRILSLIDNDQEVFLTHQTPYQIEGMHNPGGFTDGDRAVCIALALGAEEIELIGFTTNEVGAWSGVTDVKRKLIKLKWMSRVLNTLSLEVN